jgi:hypothetical protein
MIPDEYVLVDNPRALRSNPERSTNIEVFLASASVGLADETFARRNIFLRTTPLSWSNFQTNGWTSCTSILS